MRPHPRIRKFFKWGGVVVLVLLLATWAGTAGDRSLNYVAPGFEALVHGGWATCSYGTKTLFRASQCVHIHLPTPFGMSDEYFLVSNRRSQGFAVPLWLPVSVAVLGTAGLWHLDTLARRRAKLGACPKCSYSRTGLAPSAVCPECGTSALSPPPSAS